MLVFKDRPYQYHNFLFYFLRCPSLSTLRTGTWLLSVDEAPVAQRELMAGILVHSRGKGPTNKQLRSQKRWSRQSLCDMFYMKLQAVVRNFVKHWFSTLTSKVFYHPARSVGTLLILISWKNVWSTLILKSTLFVVNYKPNSQVQMGSLLDVWRRINLSMLWITSLARKWFQIVPGRRNVFQKRPLNVSDFFLFSFRNFFKKLID